MNPKPDPRSLLDDLLAGPDPVTDPLVPLLRAVRAQRRRRQLAPVAAALAAVVLAVVWIAMPWSTRHDDAIPLTAATPALPTQVAKPLFEVVRSLPMAATERLSTDARLAAVTRLHSEPDDIARATDEELLMLAGGRGVGLFRVNGRTELLFASVGR